MNIQESRGPFTLPRTEISDSKNSDNSDKSGSYADFKSFTNNLRTSDSSESSGGSLTAIQIKGSENTSPSKCGDGYLTVLNNSGSTFRRRSHDLIQQFESKQGRCGKTDTYLEPVTNQPECSNERSTLRAKRRTCQTTQGLHVNTQEEQNKTRSDLDEYDNNFPALRDEQRTASIDETPYFQLRNSIRHSGPYDKLRTSAEKIVSSTVQHTTHGPTVDIDRFGNAGPGHDNQAFSNGALGESGPYDEPLSLASTQENENQDQFAYSLHIPKSTADFPNFRMNGNIGHLRIQTSGPRWRDSTTWPEFPRASPISEANDQVTNHSPLSNSSTRETYNPNRIENTNWILPNYTESDSLKKHKNRELRKYVVAVIICLGLAGIITWIIQNRTVQDSEDPIPVPGIPEPITDPCNGMETTAYVGERICFSFDMDGSSNTSKLANIVIKQTSTNYFVKAIEINLDLNSTTIVQKDDWIIDYNTSRTEQVLRIVQPNASCRSMGRYNVSLTYEDGSIQSLQFNAESKDPRVEFNKTQEDGNIHVRCEMKQTCLPGSLALYAIIGEKKRLIPEVSVCSFNDKKFGTNVTVETTLPESIFSESQNISCEPLLEDIELAKNLTKTEVVHKRQTEFCSVDECSSLCENNPTSVRYYADQHSCQHFFQCDNGKPQRMPCPNGTLWNPAECTCGHFNDIACNKTTYEYYIPRTELLICS